MGLTFDGIDIEKTYGIIVDGASSWPKPERDVEMIHIPGRNGDLMMDNGCWHNVEISYNLLIKDDWKTKFEEFADWLCSHVGYFRLEDQERHPGVYRMAEFSGPIDPELWFTTDTGVFEIVFNCKPQQFLAGQASSYLVGSESNGVTFALRGYDSAYNEHPAGESGVDYAATPILHVHAGDVIGLRVVPNTEQSAIIDFRYTVFDMTGGVPTPVRENVLIFRLIYPSSSHRNVQLDDTMLTVDGVLYEHISFHVHTMDGVSLDIFETSNPMYLVFNKDYYGLQMMNLSSDARRLSVGVNNGTRHTTNPIIISGINKIDILLQSIAQYTINIDRESAGIGTEFAYIDAELEDCYALINGATVNINQFVEINYYRTEEDADLFPYIPIGDVGFYYTTTISSLDDFKTCNAFLAVRPRLFRI